MKRFPGLCQCICILAAAFLTPFSAVAAPPPSTRPLARLDANNPDSEISELIKRLGSDNAQDRDSAQQKLANLGQPAAASLTNAAENSDDPEVRSRAAAILAAIKDQEIGQPTLITLHGRKMSAKDVCDAIGTQAQAHIIVMGLGVSPETKLPRTVDIDVDRKPFWDVMTDVCAQLKACPDGSYNHGNSIRILPAWENWMARPTHQVIGPYWVGISTITHTRMADMNGPGAIRDRFSVQMTVFAEPKLTVASITDFTVREAVDDAGHSLMPRALPLRLKERTTAFRRVKSNESNFEFDLQYPDQQPGSKISILRGDFSLLVARDFQVYQVDDLSGKSTVTNPLTDGKIKLTVIPEPADYRVNIECSREGLGDDQWTTLVNDIGTVTLEDANRQTFTPMSEVGIHSLTDAAGSARFTASGTFALGSGKPERVIWRFPASFKAVTIPVAFKNLPMP